MARIRVFAVLALALVAGGTFAFGTYRYIQNVPARTISLPTTPVVVAAADLDLGAELRAEDLRVIQWPADAVPGGAFNNPEQLVKRGLVRPVAQNEPFLPQQLAPIEAGAGLPPVIPEGYRALSVRVNDVVGVAGYVLPGTRVDVITTINPTGGSPSEVQSKVILTNVQVLAAGTKIESSGKDNEPMQVSVVTLMVTPEESERLTLASTEGKIQLALRNPLDKTAPATTGIKPEILMAGGLMPTRPVVPVRRAPGGGGSNAGGGARIAPARAAAPPAAAPALPTVEVIRGDKRATEVVNQE